jgi:hypothetical protein
MSFSMPRVSAAPIPPPTTPGYAGSLTSFSNLLRGGEREAPISPPNTSSGANPDTIAHNAHNRLAFGEPEEPTPPPQMGTPTGQKVNLGQ